MRAAPPLTRFRAPLVLAAAALTLASCQENPGLVAPDDASFSQGTDGLVLTASHESARVVIRESLQLQVLVTNPAGRKIPHTRNLTWTSSDPSVAPVDSTGLVRGLAVGTALVTVTHENGRWADTVPVTVIWPEEARALWVNRFEYGANLGPAGGTAKIVEIMNNAKRANLNIVYFQVRGQGDAYYRSSLEPCAVSLCGSLGNGQPSWDPLEVAVREAHARGIELHAWINAFPGWASVRDNPNTATNEAANYCALLKPSRAGSPNHMLIDHPEWQMKSSGGTLFTCMNSQAYEYAYVSPGIPAVRAHMARVAADIAQRYAVDGIHLDRIRYPSQFLSYDQPSVSAFGRTAAYNDGAWMQWRQDAVSQAVKEVHDAVRAVKPRVVLSAATWSIYNKDKWGWPSSTGLQQYSQDPRAWGRGGYLDVNVPMTYFNINQSYCSYTANNPDWACLLDDHMEGFDRATGRHTYIAIGANRAFGEYERQIALGRQKGVKGFAFYSYNEMNVRARWTLLGDGLFREPASVPHMPWRE